MPVQWPYVFLKTKTNQGNNKKTNKTLHRQHISKSQPEQQVLETTLSIVVLQVLSHQRAGELDFSSPWVPLEASLMQQQQLPVPVAGPCAGCRCWGSMALSCPECKENEMGCRSCRLDFICKSPKGHPPRHVQTNIPNSCCESLNKSSWSNGCWSLPRSFTTLIPIKGLDSVAKIQELLLPSLHVHCISKMGTCYLLF